MSVASLVVMNALACENAKDPICVCACGGKYHGLSHPLSWVQTAIDEAELKATGQLCRSLRRLRVLGSALLGRGLTFPAPDTRGGTLSL